MSESEIEKAMRQVVREANKWTGPAQGWFIVNGVVFASNATAATAPKDDPSLSPEEVARVRERVRAWFEPSPRIEFLPLDFGIQVIANVDALRDLCLAAGVPPHLIAVDPARPGADATVVSRRPFNPGDVVFFTHPSESFEVLSCTVAAFNDDTPPKEVSARGWQAPGGIPQGKKRRFP